MNPEMLEQLNNLRYFEYGIKSIKGVNDYLAAGNKETPEINWYAYIIFKGIVSGIYERLRNEGSQPIANGLLLEEGISQKLSPRQEGYLAKVDKEFNL